MELFTGLGGEAAYKLVHGILLYSDGERSFATAHEPQLDGEGKVSLAPGRGLSTAFVRALAGELGTRQPIEVLSDRVLVRTPEVLVWWRPRTITPIFFAPADQPEFAPLKTLSGRSVPHPALVFRASNKQIWVRALRDNVRPSAETRLLMAPYYNVSRVGSVCTNSMRVPVGHGVDTIADWERGFVESEFTHQLAGVKQLTTYAGHLGRTGYVQLWVDLAAKVKATKRGRPPVEFPVSALLPAYGNQTLLQFAQSTADEGQR